jgi:HD-like signal output (HDOD) protein
MPVDPSARLALRHVLEGIDTLATQRPVTARIVAATEDEDTGAKELATMLAADVALAGRVTKLANSAYFGMGGRVTTLQMAVTVVGFTTVRTMATVALTDVDDESRLPEGFWEVGTSRALAAAALAPRFGERPPDALCLGLLAGLGAALLHHNDAEGYSALLAGEPAGQSRRLAEIRRYGLTSLRLTAVALEQWGFPQGMVGALTHADDLTAAEGGLVRVAVEIASRLTDPGHEPVPVSPLSGGVVDEDVLPPVLEKVRGEAEELRRAMLG